MAVIAMSEFTVIGSLIDGESKKSGSIFEVRDKYTGDIVAHAHEANANEVHLAVRAASAALLRGVPPPHERFEILNKVAQFIKARQRIFIDLIVAETGFTVADACNEVGRALITLSLCAEEARRLIGDTVPFAASPGQQNRIGFTLREPIGIVCAITPFNSPLNTVLHKIGPALAGGNAVILKPSGVTPVTADLLCHLFFEAGMPPGLLSVLHGLDARVGQMLLDEQAIQFYAFTGSTKVGRAIQAGAGLRRTQLELGSIASTILCADADLDRAVPRIANAAFRKAGQVCTSVQRVYVQRPLVDRFVGSLVREAASMTAGDPRNPDVRVGPMISEEAAQRAESWISEARQQQARVLQGGQRAGALLQPTVLTNVERGMRVVDEEIFAPVVSLIAFDDVAQAIDEVNDTPFGLSVGIFTESIDTGLRAAKALRFGSVHLNETSSARADAMPFGGVKDSGFGREGPAYAIREMTEERLVTFNLR